MATASTDSAVQKAPAWEARFLRVFAKTGIVLQACKAARIDRSTAYNHRRERPEFAARWKAAEDEACDELEQAALKRIKDGSDVLLIFMLKARRPEKYREETLTAQRVLGLFEQMLEIVRVEVGETDARRVAHRFEREALGHVANGHGAAVVGEGGGGQE